MPTIRKIMSAGLSPLAATNVVGDVSGLLTATGSTQADALVLPNDVNVFGTVAGSTGAILRNDMAIGDSIAIYVLTGQSTLTVYPPVGGAINAIATNGGFSVATNKSCTITKYSNTAFFTDLTA